VRSNNSNREGYILNQQPHTDTSCTRPLTHLLPPCTTPIVSLQALTAMTISHFPHPQCHRKIQDTLIRSQGKTLLNSSSSSSSSLTPKNQSRKDQLAMVAPTQAPQKGQPKPTPHSQILQCTPPALHHQHCRYQRWRTL